MNTVNQLKTVTALMLGPTIAPCGLTFAPYILTFGHCAWCFPSFNWCKQSICTGGGWHCWCFFIQPLAQIVHLHMWWYHPLQFVLVELFHSATDTPGQLALCGGGQWWWYVVACGGGGIYIWNLHWHLSNLHCVVVVYSGDRCMWRQSLSIYIS